MNEYEKEKMSKKQEGMMKSIKILIFFIYFRRKIFYDHSKKFLLKRKRKR